MRTYCNKRHKWTRGQFDLVHWEAIGTVRRKLPDTQKMQTCKIMNGWLPVGHMRQHITGISQCPGCPCGDETIRHVFQCPNERMIATRKTALATMLKEGIKQKIKRPVMEAICHLILSESTTAPNLILDHHSPAIKEAIEQQEEIGVHLFLRGYIAKKWETAIEASGSKHPERRVVALQRLIWAEWVAPCWATRNDILHGGKNNTTIAENQRLADRMLWYMQHKNDVLAHHDRYLAKYDMIVVQRLQGRTKREWVRQLDIARAAYEREKFQKTQNQRTLHSYFGIAEPASDPAAEGVT